MFPVLTGPLIIRCSKCSVGFGSHPRIERTATWGLRACSRRCEGRHRAVGCTRYIITIVKRPVSLFVPG